MQDNPFVEEAEKAFVEHMEQSISYIANLTLMLIIMIKSPLLLQDERTIEDFEVSIKIGLARTSRWLRKFKNRTSEFCSSQSIVINMVDRLLRIYDVRDGRNSPYQLMTAQMESLIATGVAT